MIENSDTINKYYEHFDRTHFLLLLLLLLLIFFFGGNQKKNTKGNQQ